MKENNSDECVRNGSSCDTCSTYQECRDSKRTCLGSSSVCIECTHVLKVDDLSITGKNGRENDSKNTGALYFHTQVFGDRHVLADCSHIMSKFCPIKPPDEDTQETDKQKCCNWDRDASDLQRDEIIEA